MLRLREYRVDGDPPVLSMDLDLGGYREFLGTNLRQGHRRVELEGRDGFDYADPVGTSAVVLTADRRVVLGRRSGRVTHHGGRLHCFGGILEDRDRREDGTVDVVDSIRRELREELGLDSERTRSLDCLGLVRDREIWQPELLFRVAVPLELGELRETWQGAESRDEHESLVDLPEDAGELGHFARHDRDLVPVARAALLLLADAPQLRPPPERNPSA